jgi:uncharacterized protein
MAIGADKVRQIFSHLESGSGDEFFRHVADDVDWTVEGTHPLAGRYRSKADFQAHTFARLNKILPGGTQLYVESVMTDGDRAVVELRSRAFAKNGMRFDNHYCWVMRFADDVIVEVRAYLDSALVQKLIDENER